MDSWSGGVPHQPAQYHNQTSPVARPGDAEVSPCWLSVRLVRYLFFLFSWDPPLRHCLAVAILTFTSRRFTFLLIWLRQALSRCHCLQQQLGCCHSPNNPFRTSRTCFTRRISRSAMTRYGHGEQRNQKPCLADVRYVSRRSAIPRCARRFWMQRRKQPRLPRLAKQTWGSSMVRQQLPSATLRN